MADSSTNSPPAVPPVLAPFPAYAGDEPFIFVSYAHSDRDRVFPEILVLHGLGYRLWYDEGIEAGDSWKLQIMQRVKTCAVFMAFVTPWALTRIEVLDEIRNAYRLHKKCVPVFLDKTDLSTDMSLADLDAYLNGTQGILVFEQSEETYRPKLLKALPPEVLAPRASRPEPAAAGAVLAGRYELVRSLGLGTPSSVWLASDMKLDEPVVVRFISTALWQDKPSQGRLTAAIRAAGRLKAASVVRVRDLLEHQGAPFLVSEHVEGQSLEVMIAERKRAGTGPWPAEQLSSLVGHVAWVLDYAHGAGVVHVGLRPSRVLVGADERGGRTLRLVDLGVAAGVTALVRWALSKRPEDRPGSAGDLVRHYREALTAKSAAPPAPAKRPGAEPPPARSAPTAAVNPPSELSVELPLARPLEELLKSDEGEVRWSAVKDAVRLGRSDLLPRIRKALSRETDLSVKATLVGAVGKLGGPADSNLVLGYLKDPNARVRANAVEAVALLLPLGPRHLVPMLKDPSNRVRANAVVALHAFSGCDAMSVLQEMARSEVPAQASAVWAAASIATDASVPILMELVRSGDAEISRRAASALPRWKEMPVSSRPRMQPHRHLSRWAQMRMVLNPLPLFGPAPTRSRWC